MRIAIPNLDALPIDVREAFQSLIAQLGTQSHVSTTVDGQTKRTLLSVYHNTTQSHTTSGVFEAVNFNAEDDLRSIASMTVPTTAHDTVTRPDRYVVPGNPNGPQRMLRVRARVVFAPNATGTRALRIKVNDTITRRPSRVAAATAGNETHVTAVATLPVSPGDAVHIEAYQDSGGALTMGSTDRTNANECEWELI